ncbi:citrate:succinate antiporter [Domibacillus epiphyticus]|uniref:Citrate:succinate antiporter n=2 Tax=Domibacillus epiphyticus TaxID=1714355 RepID=A0A1V2ABU5_9BACI|nr:citrate:succinate antiporter [Domibacillus epiphyticus]
MAIHVIFAFLLLKIDSLDYSGKLTMFAFLSAMTLWILTKVPAGLVAMCMLLVVILLKAGEPDILYHSLSEEVVWLMIGSFIIGEAIKQSGLADRISQMIVQRTQRKSSILSMLTFVLFLSSFFIPSTSGRAALSMPVMKQLSKLFSKPENEVLAMIVPVMILMSTSATLIGAGSHLIGIGILKTTTGQSISFMQWLFWSVPFTLVVTFLSLYVMKWRLWPKRSNQRTELVEIEKTEKVPMRKKEKKTAFLILAVALGWVTESIHGYDLAFVTVFGALLFVLPEFGVMSWKQGIHSVSWNLILFVAAASALGEQLVESGVVQWIEEEMFSFLYFFTDTPEWFIVFIILFVAVTSHLYITSHTTRAVVLIPTFIVFGQTIGADSAGIVFLSLIGMNYCVTLPVSSKALLLFYEEGNMTYDAKKLLHISIYLMPLYVLVMFLFYFTYWKWTGLSI